MTTRVLVLHGWLHERRDESLEIYETLSGLVRAAQAEGTEVVASDGRKVFDCVLGPELVFVPRGSLTAALLRDRFDVAHIHMILPQLHLALALVLRLRGVPVVLTPMSMLGDDFARGSWFRDRRGVLLRLKPLAVRALQLAWQAVATAFVVQSGEEVRQAHLPPSRCSLLPLPAPRSPLAAAATGAGPRAGVEPSAPVAFVSRLDPWRKGIDRLCGWLRKCSAELPRPAAVLFARDDGTPLPDGMREMLDEGLLRWDRDTSGAALAEALRGCRGVALLSRWDGQPRALREAALLGLPTMSTVSSHLAEVVAALGAGTLVDGDDARSVQRGFLELAAQCPDPAVACRLFDRDRIGAFLLGVLHAVAAGARPSLSYYSPRQW